MRKHVTLCLSCLRYIPLGGACGCAAPAAQYMSEAEAAKKIAARQREASRGKSTLPRIHDARKAGGCHGACETCEAWDECVKGGL